MKYTILLLIFGLFLTACVKKNPTPQQPNPPAPIITDTTLVDSTASLQGTTWVITKVLNTNFSQELRSDTLEFISNNTYKFNGFVSTYSFYPTQIKYTLTLNETPWGFITGSVYQYNLVQGVLENSQFVDYFTGQNSVKIWMTKQ